MSRRLKIVLILLGIIVLAVFFTYQKLNADLEGLKDKRFETMNSVLWKDGTTLGEAHQFPIKVKVEVTIQSKQITKITILEHQTGEGQSAEAIVDEVIRTQSLDVDAITGATYSSILILEAIEDALRKSYE
jgi:uncharacterized protein with FMN-binding domain